MYLVQGEHCIVQRTESTFHWSLDKALMPLSDINGGSTEGLILIILVNVDCVSVGDGRVLPPLPGLVVIIDHDEVVITGLLGAVLLLLILVEDDVLLYLVASGVINITRVRVSLILVYEVVTSEVLLGLQSHELVVVADADTSLWLWRPRRTSLVTTSYTRIRLTLTLVILMTPLA